MLITRTDIKCREDVELLVNTFYEKVKKNSIIGPIFNELINVNWEKHLPIMYSFWGSLLLGEQSYQGNPMLKHIELSKKVSLTEKEFTAWLELFNETVDELFVGERAEEARKRASNIARLMLYKIENAPIAKPEIP